MLAALRDKKIGGAGLDVFDVEPLPKDHPLRKMDNVVLTPHLGYVALKNYQNYFAGVVEDIRGFIDGKPVRVMTTRSTCASTLIRHPEAPAEGGPRRMHGRPSPFEARRARTSGVTPALAPQGDGSSQRR